MNPTIGTIGMVFFTSITAYGAFTAKRAWFFFGICFFSTIPVIGEAIDYSNDNELIYLILIMMFLVQVVITLPVSITYGAENRAANALGKKIAFAVLIANLFHAFLILSGELTVPHQFGYCHLAISLIMLCLILKTKNKKDLRWK